MAKRRAETSDLLQRIGKVMEVVNKECPSSHGDTTVDILGKKPVSRVPTFSSGSWALDAALGGGYPWGRIIEVYGPEGGGKTTLVLHAIANVQREFPDAMIAFIDAEHSLDLYYAKNLGVDVSTLMVSQPGSGEHGLNVAKVLIENGVKLIVIDSIAALSPEAMMIEIGKPTMGMHAKLITEATRTLNTLLSQHSATMLCTNQVRESMGGPGSGLITTGGRAFKFYASQRVEVKRIGSDVHGDVRINNIVVARVAKNKIAPPFLKAQFKITFGKGIDLIEQIIDFATTFRMIIKTGAWYEVQGADKKLNGHQQVYGLFESDEELRNSYIVEIKKKMADSDDIMEQSMNISTPKTEIVNDELELDEDVVEKLIGTLDNNSSQVSSNVDLIPETTVESGKSAVVVEKAE